MSATVAAQLGRNDGYVTFPLVPPLSSSALLLLLRQHLGEEQRPPKRQALGTRAPDIEQAVRTRGLFWEVQGPSLGRRGDLGSAPGLCPPRRVSLSPLLCRCRFHVILDKVCGRRTSEAKGPTLAHDGPREVATHGTPRVAVLHCRWCGVDCPVGAV